MKQNAWIDLKLVHLNIIKIMKHRLTNEVHYINRNVLSNKFRRDKLVIAWLVQYFKRIHNQDIMIESYTLHIDRIMCRLASETESIEKPIFINVHAKQFKKFCKTRKLSAQYREFIRYQPTTVKYEAEKRKDAYIEYIYKRNAESDLVREFSVKCTDKIKEVQSDYHQVINIFNYICAMIAGALVVSNSKTSISVLYDSIKKFSKKKSVMEQALDMVRELNIAMIEYKEDGITITF